MADTAPTEPEQSNRYRGLKPFQPGQSGNPEGRAKGSRNKLGEAFVAALLNDWEEHGIAAIEAVRSEKPSDYLKVVASVIPKEVIHTVEDYDSLSDDDLAREFESVAARLSARARSGEGNGAEGGKAPLSH